MENLKIKNIIYTLCFAFLCLIDQRIKTGSGLDGVIESFRDMNYIIVAILVLSHYRLRDFKRYWFLYVGWLFFCIVGGGLFIWKGETIAFFPNHRVVLVADMFLWGITLIRTVVGIFVEKRSLIFIRRPFAYVWLLIMVGMCILRSDIYWPDVYLMAFGVYYLTDYSEEERQQLFQGMLNGVILGFFLMQGWCFVFRPYDVVRYTGVYSNSNLNALFYLMVLAALFTKLLYTYKDPGMKWNPAGTAEQNGADRWREIGRTFLRVVVRIWYWLLAGAVLGFIVLTIGRIGYLVAVLLVLAVALMRWRTVERRWYLFLPSMLKSGVMIMLCFCLMFPVVFEALRYLPPKFHHPVWFWGEWSEERVHSWDPWNSEKYVEFEDLIEMIDIRVGQILEKTEISHVSEGAMLASADASALAKALPPKPSDVTDLQWERYQEMLAEGYAINLQEYENAGSKRDILVRYSIYRYYVHHLNWTGHPADQQGFQILPDHWYGHTHNIYLQWGIEFGIPAMVLFIVLILWTIGHLIRRFHMTGDLQYAGYLLFFLVPCLFGMLEYCWGAGSLTISLMFLTWGRVICRAENIRQ